MFIKPFLHALGTNYELITCLTTYSKTYHVVQLRQVNVLFQAMLQLHILFWYWEHCLFISEWLYGISGIWSKSILHTLASTNSFTIQWFNRTSKSTLSNQTKFLSFTVKPVYNDHLYNKIYYLSFIQQCVSMKTENTNLLLLTMSAFWSSSRWPLAT